MIEVLPLPAINGSSSESASVSDCWSSTCWSSLCSESSSCSYVLLSMLALRGLHILTVGICQLPSGETMGGSDGVMALLARSEARVIRGMVKGPS